MKSEKTKPPVDYRNHVFRPAEKLNWLKSVARDKAATDLDSRVATMLVDCTDTATGIAKVSQVRIANEIGRNVRSIRRALDRMAKRGYISVKPGPRHRTVNRYILLKQGGLESPPDCGNQRTEESAKADSGCSESGPQSPPIPIISESSSLPSFENDQHVDLNEKTWRTVKDELRRLGVTQGEMVSWFDRLAMGKKANTTVTMLAPTAHARSYIEQGPMKDYLVRAWRAAVPEITQVRLEHTRR